MKSLAIIVIAFLSNLAHACGDKPIPIELEVTHGHSGTIVVLFKAPIRHKEFYLLGAQYDNGLNQIPMYRGYQEDENVVSYEVSGVDDFFKGAVISINYAVKGTLCAHSEKYKGEHIIDRATPIEKSQL